MKVTTLSPRLMGDPRWQNSDYICALADDDRHLGHVINRDGWDAYDGTKLDSNAAGFKYLGRFETISEAKEKVELSVGHARYLTRAAGSGAFWT